MDWYDEADRHMWKMYKGNELIAVSETDNKTVNRSKLEDCLMRFDAGKYKLQIYPEKASGGGDTSKHLRCDINTGTNQPVDAARNPYGGGMYGIGDVDRLVDQRMGAVIADKIEILKKENTITELQRQLKEQEGRGIVTPWEKFMMESIGALIPYVPALVSGLTGQPVAPIKPLAGNPAPPKANPQRPAPQPAAQAQPQEEDVPAEVQAIRARFLEATRKMQEASPNWLECLEAVANKYHEKPAELEAMLPMLERL